MGIKKEPFHKETATKGITILGEYLVQDSSRAAHYAEIGVWLSPDLMGILFPIPTVFSCHVTQLIIHELSKII